MWRSFLARVLIWFVALAGLGLYAAAQSSTGQHLRNRDLMSRARRLPGGTATLTGPLRAAHHLGRCGRTVSFH